MNLSMDEIVASFTNQLEEALEIAESFKPNTIPDVDHIVVCGLGGSGIGGTIVSQLTADQCKLPISAVKDYDLPAFVGNRSLIIACSYSGNTEETLEVVEKASEKGAHITVVSSGGKLSEMAKGNNWPLVTIPGGFPPRGAFAYSLVQLLNILSEYRFISKDWKHEVEESIGFLNANGDKIKENARQLAESTVHKLPIIYTGTWLEGVGVRWRQQINENAKKLCWHHVYPEQNHNELVGWRDENHDLAVIFLKSPLDHERTLTRMELTANVYRKFTPHIHECNTRGESKIQDALELIHIGDWLSVHLANMREVDSIEVEVIDWLKGSLAKI